jgi:hypothetical protein
VAQLSSFFSLLPLPTRPRMSVVPFLQPVPFLASHSNPAAGRFPGLFASSPPSSQPSRRGEALHSLSHL